MGVKIGNIDVGEFPLLLAPMEDVSDPPFRAFVSNMVQTSCIQNSSLPRDLIRDAVKSTQKARYL